MTQTMSVAVDGRLTVHPWLRAQLRQLGEDAGHLSILDEDVFSLVVARSKATGLAGFSGAEPPTVRWGHNDAGGDWTQDASIRRLAWLQCAVPAPALNGRRIPIQPAFSVLDDVLALAGSATVHAVHAIIPLAAAPDGRFDLAAMARWFGLTNPDTTRSVSLALSAPGNDPARFRSLPRLAQSCAAGRIEPEFAEAAHIPDLQPPYGATWLLSPGEHVRLTMRCTLPIWSVDAASWLLEVLTEAMRQLEITEPVAISATSDPD